MNPAQVYMCSPSWTLLPPPSPFHPSGSSQCTSPKHPASCIEPGLATRFTHDILHVSMPKKKKISPHFWFVWCILERTLLKGDGGLPWHVLCTVSGLHLDTGACPWGFLGWPCEVSLMLEFPKWVYTRNRLTLSLKGQGEALVRSLAFNSSSVVTTFKSQITYYATGAFYILTTENNCHLYFHSINLATRNLCQNWTKC